MLTFYKSLQHEKRKIKTKQHKNKGQRLGNPEETNPISRSKKPP